jgi:hypothetical protein
MSLQYLDALKALGSSASTKFVLPMEFTNLLRPFVQFTDLGIEGQSPKPKTEGQKKVA